MHLLARVFLLLFIIFSPLRPATSDQLFDSSARALEGLESKVRKITLPNGLRILLYRRGIAPVFSGVISAGVGGVDEKRGSTGISHMFEHMAFKGTPEIGTNDYEREKVLLAKLESLARGGRDPKSFSERDRAAWDAAMEELSKLWRNEQFSQEYERRGAEGLNATTDKEQTRYFVSLPRGSFEFWCSMESERLLHPVLRQFYQERDVVLEERRTRTDNEPAGKLYEALLQTAFSIHPYRNPVIGYERDIRRLTASKLENFREQYYVPSNIVVSIVGDVDPDSDPAVIERYFGRIPAGVRPPKPSVIEPRQEGERVVTVRADAAASFMVAYHKPHYPSPDDAKITVMSEVLDGSSQSPIYVDLVKKGRVAAGVEHEEGPGVEFPNLLMFSIASKSPFSSRVVLRKFDETVDRFLRDGAPEDLLSMAKRSIAFEYLNQMKSDVALASSLGGAELQFGRWQSMIDWYEQAMAVTMRDVISVARKYLRRQNRTVAFLESPVSGARP